MASNTVTAEEYKDSVAKDRVASIRKAALKSAGKQSSSKITGEKGVISLAKKPLDKIFLNFNNAIWGISITVIPLLGLTLLMSMGLVLGLLLKRTLADSLEKRGMSLEISMPILMYTWATFILQIILTIVVYTIIYIIVNPLEVGLDALGL